MNPFNAIDWLQFLVLLICGAGLYQAAEFDHGSSWAWAGTSMGIYAVTWLYLREGVVANLLWQAGVLFGIGVMRAAWAAWRRN